MTLDLRPGDLARVPASGPLLVVANHPFGALDGLALQALLGRVRGDVKLLGNYLLHLVPELRETILPVDPFGGPGAAQASVGGLRSAVRWLREGGCIGVFPAGEVSHLDLARSRVTDQAWSRAAARLARQPEVTVLPVVLRGGEQPGVPARGPPASPPAHGAPAARAVAAAGDGGDGPRGVSDHAGASGHGGNDETLTAWLRASTYLLESDAVSPRRRQAFAVPGPATTRVPVVAARAGSAVAADFADLPASQWLARQGPFRVCYGTADQLPSALQEIGRLREVTFRAAGEGTGRAIDLDAFDRSYLHLCVWHEERREIAGAYRMGLTDVLTAEGGVAALYTHTLFRYDRRLIDRLSPAIELGRSFVRLEYQRDYAPLLLLWKGIGRFVTERPRYRRLFGPVSISQDYASTSRELLMAFLEAHHRCPELAALVDARLPPRRDRRRDAPASAGRIVTTLDEVEGLIAGIEADARGVPVLLRQYLKLHARLLGFNVDPAFGQALDGLMLVDLLDVPRPILTRYLGRDGVETFLAAHDPGHDGPVRHPPEPSERAQLSRRHTRPAARRADGNETR